MKNLLLSLLLLLVLVVSACGNTLVLGIPKDEAAELLRKGNTEFIFRAELPADFSQSVSMLTELLAVHPAAPFYAALPAGGPGTADDSGEAGDVRKRELLLLFAALESPLPAARREASEKLVSLLLRSGEEEVTGALGFLNSGKIKDRDDPFLQSLRAACLYKLGNFDEAAKSLSADPADYYPADDWGRGLSLLAARNSSAGGGKDAEKLNREFEDFLFEAPLDESRRWAAAEILAAGEILGPSGTAALEGRLAGNNYKSALEFMRPALSDGGLVFLRYPELLGDLGRAYLYASEAEEGAALFSAWIRLLDDPAAVFDAPASVSAGESGGDYGELRSYIKLLAPPDVPALKYRLFFYSGRFERARGNYNASSDNFKAALEFAPDDAQSDACVWYMLMNAVNGNPSGVTALCLSTMPQWKDMSYFFDILDRLAGSLVAGRRWNSLLEIFNALEDKGRSPSLVQYAWILGRAAEEGYLTTGPGADYFFRAALGAGDDSLYYRIMASAALGLKLVPDSRAAPVSADSRDEAGLQFILGFFEYGAASFALPYIEACEDKLAVPELRKIAEAFAARGEWRESLNLVSRYTGRENHRLSRADLLLLYPRPFRKLAEQYAREAGLDEALLYGLIRTESYFQPGVVSRSGAIGLVQLMAPTALDMAGRIARQGGPDYRAPGGIDLRDPDINVHIGSYYLDYLMKQMGNPMLALLAYNGGMGRVRRWVAADRQRRDSLPYDLFLETVELRETREYGRLVLSAAAVYGYLYYGTSPEKTARAIYNPRRGNP